MTTQKSVELREQSGNEITDSNFIVFLYCLIRDELTPGRIERVIDASVFNDVTDNSTCQNTKLTNGYIAQYAKNIIMRLATGHNVVYKIRDSQTGLFVDGTQDFEWNSIGKIWKSLNLLRRYIDGIETQYGGIPDHFEVVQFSLVETQKYKLDDLLRQKSSLLLKKKLITYTDEKQ